MKTKAIKNFDAVGFSRRQKDKLSAKFAKMTEEEILDYLKQQSEKRGRVRSASTHG